jgi:hypothetical protein
MGAERYLVVRRAGRAEGGGRLLARKDRSDAHVLVAQVLEPCVTGAALEDRRQFGRELFLLLVVLTVGKVRASEQLREACGGSRRGRP